jgi:hypothetical protein
MKKYDEEASFHAGTRGELRRPGSSSSLFAIPIDGVHFAALSASPRTPREMMHDRPGHWNTQMAPRVRSTRRSRIGAPLAVPARTQNA